MKKLKIKLEHCYGIEKLKHEFDFSDCRTCVIYAPNGVMKTSFAKTFKAISGKKEKPHDQMNDTLTSVYDILIDDTSEQIDPEKICVIEPYNEKAFDSEDKILTLLADEETRNKYLKIFNEIDSLKKATIPKLKKISGSGNYEVEIIETFSQLGKKNIFEIFDAILDNIRSSSTSFKFKYNDVFDPAGKVKKFLEDNIDLLNEYIEKYENLIIQSSFFSKKDNSVFGTTEAKSIDNALDGDDYFIAGHKLQLNNYGEVTNQERFSEILNNEIDKIFDDDELKKIFTKIDKALDANKELKAFKKVLERKENKFILPRLADYEEFRKEVWFSFLKQIEAGVEDLVNLYNSKSGELEEIIKEAKDRQSEWETAISEFENRFVDTPFAVEINNKADAILNEKTPAIDFKFHGKDVERKKLIDKVLSQGEKRAFYLLNVIFEIKSRQLQNKETLYIIDDIADSFDYKNKYAIVEYLSDISQNENFYSIILTHNFDLYRTISSRLSVNQDNRLHAERKKDSIVLIKEQYQSDPFQEWKNNLNQKNIIALIPFVRNLIEYGINDKQDFIFLTHLLHKKEEIKYFKNGSRIPISRDGEYSEENGDFIIKKTEEIKFKDIEGIFRKYLGIDSFPDEIDLNDSVYDKITNLDLADFTGSRLEHKIVLAIAIRLISEEFMINKINNINYVNKIAQSQTNTLIKKLKGKINAGDIPDTEVPKEKLDLLDSVNIMTPENIHINSFMYEPILDMGIDELKKLYEKVSRLSNH